MRLKEVRVLQGRGHVGHHQQVQQQEVSGEDVRAGVQQDELQQLQGQTRGGIGFSGRPGYLSVVLSPSSVLRSLLFIYQSLSHSVCLSVFVFQSIYF